MRWVEITVVASQGGKQFLPIPDLPKEIFSVSRDDRGADILVKVFCVAENSEYLDMHCFPRLEYEATSYAISGKTFFPRPLLLEQHGGKHR